MHPWCMLYLCVRIVNSILIPSSRILTYKLQVLPSRVNGDVGGPIKVAQHFNQGYLALGPEQLCLIQEESSSFSF